MNSWDALRQRLDKIEDLRWGEPVELYPWVEAGLEGTGQPDTTRKVLKTTGVYVTAGASLVGEGGIAAGLGRNLQQVEMDVWLSINEDVLGDINSWQAHDRVYFPERDQWFEILYVAPSATHRPNIHLIRLNETAIT